jgi:hypothetical protein
MTLVRGILLGPQGRLRGSLIFISAEITFYGVRYAMSEQQARLYNWKHDLALLRGLTAFTNCLTSSYSRTVVASKS